MELLFLRHAESLGNLKSIMQGRKDYALSERGHQQAQIVADFLKTQLFAERLPTHIYCSPLKRTMETAAPFRAHFPDLPFECHDDLVEVDSGIFSGLTWAQAGAQYPEIQKRFKAVRDWGAVPEGESKVALWQRAQNLISELSQRHNEDDYILMITHGGFIRASLSVLMGVPPDEAVFIAIDNTALSLAGQRHGRRFVRYINNTQHLQPCDFQSDYIPH